MREADRERISRQLALLWVAVAVGLIALAPLAPLVAGLLWSCPFKSLFGIPCPTCGAGRSALMLASGQWIDALVTYPLMTFGWLALIGGGLWCGFALASSRPLPRLPQHELPGWARLALIGAIGASWIYSIATGV